MKPVIIKPAEVLDALIKGDEVLCIVMGANGKVFTTKLSEISVAEVRDLIKVTGSEFFVRLTKEDAKPEEPTEEPTEETPTPTEPEEPEDNSEEESSPWDDIEYSDDENKEQEDENNG